MRNLISITTLIYVVAALSRCCFAQVDLKPAGHETMLLEGFKVRVDTRLTKGLQSDAGKQAITRLQRQLSDAVLLVPADRLVKLQTVSIQLDFTNGALHSPQYHPSADWLKDHGYDPHLEKCVHIPDARYYLNVRFQREQPFAILHELAHSYHDQVLGFDNSEIRAAYEHIVQSHKFESVLHISGRMLRHYALTDEKEFFAEMTETYFGANDFYPFNSAELHRDEPEIFDLMQKIWGRLP